MAEDAHDGAKIVQSCWNYNSQIQETKEEGGRRKEEVNSTLTPHTHTHTRFLPSPATGGSAGEGPGVK